MKIILKKILYIFLFHIPFLLMAQIDRTKAPKLAAFPKIKLAKLKTFELSNQLKVIVVEDHKEPTLRINFFLDHPPIAENQKAGIGSILFQMLRSGTKKYTKELLDNLLEEFAIDLSLSQGSIYLSSLSKYTEKSLEILSELICHPTLSSLKEFNRLIQQKSVLTEAMSKDPKAIHKKVFHTLYYGKDHPYGQIPSAETLKNIKLEDIKERYNTYCSPHMAYLIFIGDITKKKAKELTQKYFLDWKKKDISFQTYKPKAPISKTEINLVHLPNATQSLISVGSPTELKKSDEDYLALYLFNNILGGISGRLFSNLREKHGYTYGAYSSIISDKYYKGSFEAYTKVQTKYTQAALIEILKELKEITSNPVKDQELNLNKRKIIGNFLLNLESPHYIASLFTDQLIYGIKANFYKNYAKNIDKLTPTLLLKAAHNHISSDHLQILIISNIDKILPDLKKLGLPIKLLDSSGNFIKQISF